MRKIPFVLLFISHIIPAVLFAQNNKTLDSLCRSCKMASTDTEKVATLNNLANYYYENKFAKQGDSVLELQLHIAELSNNKNLVLKTYFDNSIANIAFWSTAGDFNKALDFIQRGIDYAKKVNDYTYIVIGYTRLAGVLRKRGMMEQAVTNATTALMNIQAGVPDSLRAIAYMELGDCYQAKGEAILASRNYNNAFDIAIKSENYQLETSVYRRLSELYKYLGDDVEAKDQLIASLTLNRKKKNAEGMIKDYFDLARLESDVFYITEALRLADSLHLNNQIFRAKQLMLAYYTVEKKDSKLAFDYLHSQPELLAYFMASGMQDYYFERGEIHRYGGNADSALYFFKLAEPGMLSKYDVEKNRYLFYEVAACYEMKQDRNNAITYYVKSLELSEQVHALGSIAAISASLTDLYKANNDFKNALTYKEQATATKDSLSELAKNKDLTLLSVERDKKQHDEEMLRQEQSMTKKRNLQYMSITIAICLVFIGMFVIGMFPVSKLTIRLLGYFFFISLFEFIVLVLDNNILHTITHGEPLKLWLIKIGLIGMLVPIQHFLEHGITKFLQSRQLLKARKKFSFKSLFAKKTHSRKHAAKKDNSGEIEEDAAVL